MVSSVNSAGEQRVFDEYRASHLKSSQLHDRASRLFAANGATHFARQTPPFRPYIVRASGSHKWDEDGNEYLDYTMGHGALILGHSHPTVVKAIQDQAARGLHYGENHVLEIEWGELIQMLMPSAEKVEFCACGNEANLFALRLARVFTGRKRILRFAHHFHGWADELADKLAPGIVSDEADVIPANDIAVVQRALSTGQYAALFTEGGGASMGGRVPLEQEFVCALQDITKANGTIWILDEVVTGFRDAPGGYQSLVGVQPDLTTLGKCVAGGMAAGAVVGRAAILDLLHPTTSLDRRIRHSGTWNASPIVSAAGVAACGLYLGGEPQRIARQMADLLRLKGNELLRKKKICGRLYGRSIVHLYLGPIDFEPSDDTLPPTKDPSKVFDPTFMAVKPRLDIEMIRRGVATMGGWMFILSAAHTEQDVDQTLAVLGDAVDALITEGRLEAYKLK